MPIKAALLKTITATGWNLDSVKILFALFTTLCVLPIVTALSAAMATACLFKTPTKAVIVILWFSDFFLQR